MCRAASAGPSLAEVIGTVQPKIVKIYGAGGLRGLEAYQSGFLVSAEGHIVTVWSYVLDTDEITVTLNDGRKYKAQLVGTDPRLDLAVLKVEGEGLPSFKLEEALEVDAGTRVLAFSNLFGVATGDEAASVQKGAVAVKTSLAARRGAYETPYNGPVYVLDAMTNNPGAPGGALVTHRGELIGLLGKELRNSQNNTWLNYAIPIDQLRETVAAIEAGKFMPRSLDDTTKKSENPVNLKLLGIVLVPDVLERTPPFIDEVRAGSVAAKAGLRPDDLLLFVNGRLVQSCKALNGELDYLDREEAVQLTVVRGQQLIEISLKAPDAGVR
jgi:serine protease Do